ncbi:MAG: cytochrome c family protein [Fimbriimonadaceae bacterium]|nr:cytochrome c family protein [Fimbriimonadaceae bacterium]
MKGGWWLAAAAAIAGWMSKPTSSPADDAWIVLVSGDVQGYLSPCGCTKPMSGGVRRRTSLIKSLTVEGRTLILESGSFAGEPGRQAELKADALAQIWREIGVDAVQLTTEDARLGIGQLAAVQRLSDRPFVSLSATPQGNLSWEQSVTKGPWRISSAVSEPLSLASAIEGQPSTLDQSVRQLVEDASAANELPILLLDGDQSFAEQVATNHPALRLIVFRDPNRATSEPIRVGGTWLVSPGPKGKTVLRLSYRNGKWQGMDAIDLGPEIEDDPTAEHLYHEYLNRVREEQLLARMPRKPAQGYIGSKACMSCHQEAYVTWLKSEHGHALKTLEEDRHDADPECVGCHVVGLDAEDGFRSRDRTPDLADVGCESCHGPAAAHSEAPELNKLRPLAREICLDCHNPEHSPTFDWDAYWPNIAHGLD